MEETKTSKWNKPVGELTTKEQLVMSMQVSGAILGLYALVAGTAAGVQAFRNARSKKALS